MRSSDAQAAKEQILAWGRASGLAAIRVTPAEPPAHGRFLLEWLRRGYHGAMDYLARDPSARVDPERILHGCGSILCVGLDYGAGADPAERDPTLGRISRYAWGADYHAVLKEKLDGIARKIEREWPGSRTRVAVDTSPVLEKAFAAAAGLGWWGKHTGLIAPERGSWFFLGEVFTTLPLPPDAAIENRCGNCTRCIDACPTSALVEPYVLDARRCLAYWNIEHRGPIAEEFEAAMGNWIFGCDLCQLACPWNRSGIRPSDPRLDRREEILGRPLDEWAELDREAFRRRFRNSAVKRARYDGLLRNIAIARRNAHRRSGPTA